MNAAERFQREARAEAERKADDALRQRVSPPLVFKDHTTPTSVPPPSPTQAPQSIKAEITKQLASQLKDRDHIFAETVAEFVVTRERKLREHLQREDGIIKDQLQRLQGEVSALSEQAAQDRTLASRSTEADRVEREQLRREITQLSDQLALERGLRTLHDEVATARSEIPKVPAVISQLRDETTSARAAADRKIAALERELKATKERLSKARVEQSQTNYQLSKFIEEQAAAPHETIEIETSVSRFAMRGISPTAARALREFAAQIISHDGRPVLLSGSAGNA